LTHAASASLADIQPRPLRWLWPGRVPFGKLCLICGDPGYGKSLLSLDIIARHTAGLPWPDQPSGKPPDPSVSNPRSAILLSAEDDPADTLRPRLEAAGGVPARVHLLTGVARSPAGGSLGAALAALAEQIQRIRRDRGLPRTAAPPESLHPQRVGTLGEVGEVGILGTLAKVGELGQLPPRLFNLARDLIALAELLVATRATLVVIDPITAYLSRSTYSDAEVRAILAPLAALAARHGAAIVGVLHLNKATSRPALYRIGGSIAFPASARVAHLVTVDPNDPTGRRRLFLPFKSNLSVLPSGLAFTIENHTLAYPADPSQPPVAVHTARLAWDPAPTLRTAADALAQTAPGAPPSARAAAQEFLKAFLAAGPRPTVDVEVAARAAGHSHRTLQRAALQLGMRHLRLPAEQDPARSWAWSLPGSQPAETLAEAADEIARRSVFRDG
jgi:hypothetical protein